jgi:hypothetical protein
VLQHFVLRSCPTAAHVAIRTGADSILGIVSRFSDLILSGEIRSFPHFGEAGTAVFAVEEVEYGGHDLTPLFDLHHKLQVISFLGSEM